MRIYIYELIIVIFNILCGIYQLRFNHKVAGIINLVLSGIIIILCIVMAIQDIKAYFYNKEIRKKYEGEK